jgi:2-C-methyl-D-erythritol 4-phosphate cytidylyltransferase
MRCGAVIPAAGSARRFGEIDKTTMDLAGKPVLAWAIDALVASGVVSEIVVAVNDRNVAQVRDLIAELEIPVPCVVVRGGRERQDSVQVAVASLGKTCELVLIHDAARPLVSSELIQAVVQSGREHGAAIAAVSPVDTIKRVESGRVAETLNRDELVQVQTPQVFRRDWLLQAYERTASDMPATDESTLIESAGFPVHIVEGDRSNLKITVPEDLQLAAALLSERKVT